MPLEISNGRPAAAGGAAKRAHASEDAATRTANPGRAAGGGAAVRSIGAAEQYARTGDLESAARICDELLAQDPDRSDALQLLGSIKLKQGARDAASELLLRAETLSPTNAIVQNNLGAAALLQGEIDEALRRFARAVKLDAAYLDAWDNLLRTLRTNMRFRAAAAAYTRFLAIYPERHQYWNELGYVLLALRNAKSAEQALREAIRRDPNHAAYWLNFGTALDKQGRTREAMDAWRKCLDLVPDMAPALNNLAGIFGKSARHAEAVELYRKAIALAPKDPALFSNLLFTLNYLSEIDDETLLKEHREWARRHAGAAPRAGSHLHRREDCGQITVGYVSADFYSHPVAYFMGALLAAHDRRRFRIICYASVQAQDIVTRQLKKVSPLWRDVGQLSNAELADRIAADGVDILVDLGGHTGYNRLGAFVLKPAPVQVTYLGYPNTTGLDAIDYRFTDAWADPPGITDRWHTERLVRLPGGFLSYTPPSNIPAVVALPALKKGHVTFGSFNNAAKTSDATVKLWAEVLDAVPGSRLFLKAMTLDDAEVADTLRLRYGACGIDPERIELRGRVLGNVQHLQSYGSVDIALDSHPYNGTTTTCEALWMGVPVVTLAGSRHAARVGTSILSAAGLGELVAVSAADYIARAKALAEDLPALEQVRRTLRERVMLSPLADSNRLARAVEAAYAAMWQAWVRSPPSQGRSSPSPLR